MIKDFSWEENAYTKSDFKKAVSHLKIYFKGIK